MLKFYLTDAWLVEVQQYMIWVYRYIATVLCDTVKCELADFYR